MKGQCLFSGKNMGKKIFDLLYFENGKGSYILQYPKILKDN